MSEHDILRRVEKLEVAVENVKSGMTDLVTRAAVRDATQEGRHTAVMVAIKGVAETVESVKKTSDDRHKSNVSIAKWAAALVATSILGTILRFYATGGFNVTGG